MANRRTAPVATTGDAQRDIGGAVVRRRFSQGGRELTNGMVLSPGEVEAIKPNNRKALLDNGYIQIFPRPARSHLEADLEVVPTVRHAISIGFGRWDVIEGKKINAEPLTRELAAALARPIEYQPQHFKELPPAAEAEGTPEVPEVPAEVPEVSTDEAQGVPSEVLAVAEEGTAAAVEN